MSADAIRIEEIPISETPMPDEKANSSIPSYLGLVLAAASLASGVLGGFVGSVATASQWKGEVQTKIDNLEKQRTEDRQEYKQQLDYWRTQNEVIGKQLASIAATLDATKRR